MVGTTTTFTFTAAAAVLLSLAPSLTLAASGTGRTTRYWDCCKPSCSWSGKAAVVGGKPVGTCRADNSPLSDPNVRSGCDGGSAFTCANMSPWAVSEDLACKLSFFFFSFLVVLGLEGLWEGEEGGVRLVERRREYWKWKGFGS